MDFAAAADTLEKAGLGAQLETLRAAVDRQFGAGAHGNLRQWRQTLAELPSIERSPATVRDGCVMTEMNDLASDVQLALETALLSLSPWRKGPFAIGDLKIDAEWRSDRKWDRVSPLLSPLEGRRVLDVGCGNGYYAMRMHLEGARAVVGVDPTMLHVVQFEAIRACMAPMPVTVLPLRLEDLPLKTRNFDTVFSMGVLYHQRAPIDHLRQLRDGLRAGGEVLLETLVLPDSEALSRTPPDRYARMRNVWHLPSVAELEIWLARAGFRDIVAGDACRTTTDEQRRTRWMPFDSLADALSPDDPGRTVEGWPAPLRIAIKALAR